MKVKCSDCGKEGIVELSGNSVRVIHYQWIDGKRVFVKHKTNGNRKG